MVMRRQVNFTLSLLFFFLLFSSIETHPVFFPSPFFRSFAICCSYATAETTPKKDDVQDWQLISVRAIHTHELLYCCTLNLSYLFPPFCFFLFLPSSCTSF